MDAVSWRDFEAAEPKLAETGRARLHGRVSYLATARRSDGAPRVHPVTPIISDERLFLFMEPTSPKGHDLEADPRYALHGGVEDDQGGRGEFFVSGTARRLHEPADREAAVRAASYAPSERYILFELLIARADSRRYTDTGPEQATWRAGRQG